MPALKRIKRTRTVLEDSDSDDQMDRTLDSTASQISKKRRITLESNLEPDFDSDTDTGEDSHEKVVNTQVNVGNEFTQKITEKLRKSQRSSNISQIMTQSQMDSDDFDDGPAESGIIIRLELYNFMCHHAFSLDFGGQTNFIIGRNGSGKSAVLTGLSVALGARASDTDRGNSLKGLIMHGKNVARVKVIFKNEGKEAYKPDIYGKRIQIERIIKNVGSSGFSIRNEDGKVVSIKKRTVNEIMDYYGITIGNPMTILTQTEAKTFLAHSDDTEKFKYFMQGTRLQESYDNVSSLEKDVKEIEKTIFGDEDILTQAKAKYQEALKVWTNFRNSDEFKKKQEILSGKRLWLEVCAKEDQLKRATEVLEHRREQLKAIDRQCDNFEADIQRITKQKLQQKALITADLIGEINKTDEQKSNLKNDFQETHQKIGDFDVNIRSNKKEIEEDNQAIRRVDKQIEAEKARIKNSTGEAYESLKQLKTKLEGKLSEMMAQSNANKNSIEELKLQSSSKSRSIDSEIGELRREMANLENNKRRIFEAKGKEDSLFSPQIRKLARTIKQSQNSFSGKVVGPIGLEVRLKDKYKRWGWVLETVMQRTLNSVLAENFRDSNHLKSTVRNFRTNNDITVRRPEIFDYSRSVPTVNCNTILDALEIKDKNIECFLVDANKIHNTLLVADRREAERILKDDHTNSISSALCFVQGGGALRITKRNGALQVDPVQQMNRSNPNIIPLAISGGSMNLMDRVQAQIGDISERIRVLNQNKHTLTRDCEKKLLQAQHDLKAVSQKIFETKAAINRASSKLEDMEGGGAKLEALQDHKSELEDRVTIHTTQDHALRERLKKLYDQLESQKMKFKDVAEKNMKLKQQYRNAQQVIQNYDMKLAEFNESVEHNKTKKLKFESDIQKLTEFTRDNMPSVINMLIEKASNHCSREEANLKPEDTIEGVDREIESITESLKKIEEEVGISREAAGLNVVSTRKTYKGIRSKLDDAIKLHNHLSSALQTRFDNLTSTVSLLILEVNSAFESAMRLRNFSGKIDFDPAHGKLTLKVSTKPTEKLRSVESFSGGEKSYAQIAFLLSIWKPMQSRVRGLDEFDVFMDQVNRRLALKLILEKVSENPKTQTMFITPLSISKVEGLDSKSIRIHEITPPERRNLDKN